MYVQYNDALQVTMHKQEHKQNISWSFLADIGGFLADAQDYSRITTIPQKAPDICTCNIDQCGTCQHKHK